MESHEVLREAFQRTSPKEIAAELGLSLSLVYKWAQPGDGRGSGVDNPLDRVGQIIRMTSYPGLIEWLCMQAGGFFVHNPKPRPDGSMEVFPATNEIIQQFADLLECITASAKDHSITPDESEKIRHEWDSLKAYAEQFVLACEKGDFAEFRPRRRS
jgi:hypothetical protein